MEDFLYKGAFVTGAASGIGLAIASACARLGMKVMLADIDAEKLDEAMDDLADEGADVMSVVCDVADPASVAAAAERTFKDMGKVHLLCNNAGVAAGGPLHQVAAADWDWVLAVNLCGVIHGLQAFVPHMLAHGEGGHIVNTASVAGMVSAPGLGPYSASKFAVVSLSETLRAELGEQDIGVSVLCPGFVRTRIYDSGRHRPALFGGPKPPAGEPTAQSQQMRAMIEAGMDPDRVAERVLAAVRANEPYIFTHKEMAPPIRQRLAAIGAALDRLEG